MDAKGTALIAVMLNAERLRLDAQILFENGRYASAVALAVLAVEEVGKLVILGDLHGSKSVVGHQTKRNAVHKEIWTDLAINASFDIVADHARQLGTMPPGLDETQIDKRIRSKYDENSKVRLLCSLENSSHDPKNKALYVDLNSNGDWSIQSDPAGIGAVMAREWVTFAYDALQAGSPMLYSIIGDG